MNIEIDLDKNMEILNSRLGESFDIVIREITDFRGVRAAVVFSDGLVDKELIAGEIIRPLLGYAMDSKEKKRRGRTAQGLMQRIISTVDVEEEQDMDRALTGVLSGDTVIFFDGADNCFMAQTRKWQSRSISTPDTQQSVRGPKEGFTETLLFNAAMLRRKIKSDRLALEAVKIGTVTKTDVCVAYLKGTAEQELIDQVKRRLAAIETDHILDSAQVERYISEGGTFFSTAAENEKPDVVAGKLLKGRVALIVDGSPFVLTVPMVFAENFQTSEDRYMRPIFANMLLALRYLAYAVSLILPAVYVAMLTYHKELLPEALLDTLQLAVKDVPMPIVVEMAMMLVLYEMLKEAMLRLPKQIGAAVGMVGVLIIGEAAVGVKMIGAPTVVIAAITFITSALSGAALDSASLIRFGFLVLSGIFGMYGVMTGAAALVIHLCSVTSFGAPYMSPLAPFSWMGLKYTMWRSSYRRRAK